MVDRIWYGLNEAATKVGRTEVTLAEFVAYCDKIYNQMAVTKPSKETSKFGDVHVTSGRLIIEPTGVYGNREIWSKFPNEEKKLLIKGINHHGITMINNMKKCWLFLLERTPESHSQIDGYRYLPSPPYPADEYCMPTIDAVEEFNECGLSFTPSFIYCPNARELIKFYLKLNKEHNKAIKEGLKEYEKQIEAAKTPEQKEQEKKNREELIMAAD
jgi:hypothetical protein